MADFDQTQDELSAFLETQFASQAETTEQPKEPENDDDYCSTTASSVGPRANVATRT